MKPTIIIFLLLCVNFLNAQHTEVKYLSGTDKDNTVDWDFYVTDGMNSGEWNTIPVPSQWELQGFGAYNYGRENPEEMSDEKGMYKYSFEVPANWKKKKVNIVFEGSMTDTDVKINGKSAGPIHQGSFYRFKYDISKLLNYGKENLLEVTVSKKSANESVNEAERYADYWIFGGIFRPVYLEALPKEHIERFALDAKANGDFYLETFLQNINQADRLEAYVTTLANKEVGKPMVVAMKKNNTRKELKTTFNNIKSWNPEFPNLYKIKLKLFNGNELIHQVEDRFGFRTVELRPHDGIYVNGERVIFKGVNRHSFWPTSGRTTSKTLSIQDIKLMKEMNMNAVRMSHYPPDVHFLDACDSLGLFVLDELAGWQDAYDTKAGKILVKEMITRDVNHPSIVVWSNGNEGGNNFELDDDFHLYDPQDRPLIHPWAIFRDTDTQHYKDYNCCTGTLFHGEDVFFPTEFLHGLFDGGHGAGLEDHWNLMMGNPLSAGGFLWVFADEGVVRTDMDDKVDVFGSNAPDGIVGPYREKEGSFYTIKEIWAPVQPQINHITHAFDGKIKLENDFIYTNLNQCEFGYQLVKFPTPDEEDISYKTMSQGDIKAPDVAPKLSGHLMIDLPENWQQNDALILTTWDPHGNEIYSWNYPINQPTSVAQSIVNKKPIAKISVSEESGFIVIEASNTTYKFDQNKGLLAEVHKNGQQVSFNNGPQLATGDASFKSLEHFREADNYKVVMNYEGDMEKAVFTIYPSGWLELDYDYLIQGRHDFMGINFDYPQEKVNGVKWLGNGPYRVWKNRLKGVELNVWQKDYNNSVTGESWNYPEFKGFHSNLYWAVLDTDELPITMVSASDNMYLRLFTPAEPEGAYNDNTEPAFPDGNISFLNGINAIGTKFKKPEQLGPQSRPNLFQRMGKPGNYLGGKLYFYFGE